MLGTAGITLVRLGLFYERLNGTSRCALGMIAGARPGRVVLWTTD